MAALLLTLLALLFPSPPAPPARHVLLVCSGGGILHPGGCHPVGKMVAPPAPKVGRMIAPPWPAP